MTREEILKLDGPALDRAIAERVMGWTVDVPAFVPHHSLDDAVRAAEKHGERWGCGRGRNGIFAYVEPDNGPVTHFYADTPALALARAVLMAAEDINAT